MISLGQGVIQGMLGMFYMNGIEIENLDMDNHILTLVIPKDSYDFHRSEKQPYHDPESFAKRMKRVFIEMGVFPENCKVRYRVKDIVWTKEMGERNYQEHKEELLSIGRGYF